MDFTPWKIGEYRGNPCIRDQYGNLIISWDWSLVQIFGLEWVLKRAHLIAAAPELLEACEAALEDGQQYRLSEMIKQQLRAALAKARGTQEE